jgi:HAMP domain-containing protein
MRIRRFKFGLRWKLNLLIGAIVVVTMTLFEGLSLYGERQMLINARAQHLEELAHHLAWVVRTDREQDQQNLIFNYERAINMDGAYKYRALILNDQAQVVAASNPQFVGTVMDDERVFRGYKKLAGTTSAQVYVQDTTQMAVALPMALRSDSPGAGDKSLTVLISGPLDDIQESLKSSLLTHVFHLLITALAIAIVTNLALSAFVLRPIRKLLAGMRRMERGEWTNDLPIKSSDEIGRLTKGYNALGRNLELKVRCLVRAEKLASVALVAIHWNRELKKPIERIRGSAEYLCRHNAFDSESAHAIGRIFDQTERILGLSEKFNRDFSAQFESEGNRDEKNKGARPYPNDGPGSGPPAAGRRSLIFSCGDFLFLILVGAIASLMMYLVHSLMMQIVYSRIWHLVLSLFVGMSLAMIIQTLLALGVAPILGSIESAVPSMVVAMIVPMVICLAEVVGISVSRSGALLMGTAGGIGILILIKAYDRNCRKFCSAFPQNGG